MTSMISKMARALDRAAEEWSRANPGNIAEECPYEILATAALQALREPTEEMWGGLARQIMMWLDMGDRTPRALFRHLGVQGERATQCRIRHRSRRASRNQREGIGYGAEAGDHDPREHYRAAVPAIS